MKLPNCFPDDTDAYKVTQHLLQKKELNGIYSYGEHRKGAQYPASMFFGAQIICIDHFVGEVVTKENVQYAQDKAGHRFGTPKYFNRKMYDYIINKYGGMLPVRIKAVKEGTLVPINNVLFTMESLDDKCIPLVKHMETMFMQNWYPSTVCTNSFYGKRDTLKHLIKSGTPESINFKWADFGNRACSGQEQAARGGAAHLVHFNTSDTQVADRAVDFYYGTKEGSILKSVIASEHADALQYGPGEGEYEYVHACLDAAPDDAIVSIVIDTFDQDNFIDNVLTREDIKIRIVSRAGITVPRQDSGDPKEKTLRNLNSLSISYGWAQNNKGYRVINPKLNVLQGDGMQRSTIDELYTHIEDNKWSSDNLLPGSGSGTLVKGFERDTQRMAIKPSQMSFTDRGEVNVCKEVKSQPDKRSKTGRLKLHDAGGAFMTLSSADMPKEQFAGYIDSLETIFENGELKRKQTFDEVREIAAGYL